VTAGGRALREILFVELLGGLGDLLIALPAVHGLADSHPGARVHVLTFAPAGELLAMDPRVAGVTSLTDHSGATVRDAVLNELARRPADLVVTTTRHSQVPAAIDASGVPEAVTNLWRGPGPDEFVGRRFVRLLTEDGWIVPGHADKPGEVALSSAEVAHGRRALTSAGGDGRGSILLVPDSGMAVKRWPSDRWAELARLLAHRRHRVVQPHVRPPARPVPGVPVLPPLPLRTFAGVCAAVGDHGGVVVGSDTGPVRLARSVGARTVTLYGPTVASRYGVMGGENLQGLPNCPIRRPLAITEQECWWSARCPLATDGPACMSDITAQWVLDAVETSLRSPRPPVGETTVTRLQPSDYTE
jgi:ADP-heptose:LPS heptosyltransferase